MNICEFTNFNREWQPNTFYPINFFVNQSNYLLHSYNLDRAYTWNSLGPSSVRLKISFWVLYIGPWAVRLIPSQLIKVRQFFLLVSLIHTYLKKIKDKKNFSDSLPFPFFIQIIIFPFLRFKHEIYIPTTLNLKKHMHILHN